MPIGRPSFYVRFAYSRRKATRQCRNSLAALSAISMTVFPFLALPVTSRVLGLTVDAEATQRLADHTTRVLLEGIRAREERP